MTRSVPVPIVPPVVPTLLAAAGKQAARHFLEVFATLRNPRTRRAYARAVSDFLAWCEAVGVVSLATVQPRCTSRPGSKG